MCSVYYVEKKKFTFQLVVNQLSSISLLPGTAMWSQKYKEFLS